MQQEQLEKFKAWFGHYVAAHYGDDKYINANLRSKETHTKRTCQEILYLADQLNLEPDQKRLAELIALFHDIGRFRQFVKYRTYNDPRSINHCLLGLEVLRETNVLNGIDPHQKELLERAIEYHGLIELPSGLDPQCLLFSKLIRDADKLDVFFVVIEYYKQHRDNPDEFKFEMEFPDEPQCSEHVIEAILAGKQLDYSTLRTWNDMKLMQLGWVYDVNFAATLKRIKKRRVLETILDFLPQTQDIEKVREKIFNYVDWRISQDEQEQIIGN